MSDRHRFRAEWHNYQEGVFFVTICAHAKKCLFGHIQDGNIHFSKIGKIINECISEIPNHHQDTKVWNYVIMPNHIHIVLHITPKSPTEDYQNLKSEHTNLGCLKVANHSEICEDFHHNSRLSVIIGSFKASVTRCVRMNLKNIEGRTRSIESTEKVGRGAILPFFLLITYGHSQLSIIGGVRFFVAGGVRAFGGEALVQVADFVVVLLKKKGGFFV